MARSIAVIGLGAMGLPMAARLLKAGFEVRGADLNPAALDTLAGLGGVPCPNPATAVAEVDAVLISVVNADQMEGVLFGREGAAPALKPEAVVIAAVTMAPETAAALGRRLADRGIAMLDAPVSGGVKGARQGTLTVIASGSEAVFVKMEPVLKAISDRVFRISDRPGDASTVKLLNQMLCGIHIAATAEVVALAEKLGIAPAILHDVVTASSGNSHMFADRAPDMSGTPPPVKAAVDIFLKDLGLACELARGAEAIHPLSSAAHQLFAQASAAGLGPLNDSELVQVLRRG